MTISWQRFIDETTNSPLSQLVTGTNNPPKSTEIPKQETKEVYDKALSDYVKERQSAKWNIEALQPTKSEIPDNRIKPSFIKEPSTATISPADWFQTSQIKAEMESPQKSTDVITESIWWAKETALSLQTARDTANTSTLSEQRDIARPQFEKMRVQTLSFAKPILDKDQDTQWLIETAKTWKTNIFENAYRNNVEYGVGSSINTIFPDQWVDISEDTVYFTNSQATVKKPTLKNTLNFQNSKIEDAYNSITYNFAHNWDMYSVEQVKEFYKEWKNVPDDVIQQFIYDCCYDVQNWKRRNIDKYAEFYPALSNADGYVNQKDSLLQLLTNENFVSWGLGEYLTIDWEDWKDATKFLWTQKWWEDLTELLVAANTIAWFADMLNEAWANISQATDYAIVKSYADMYPELQKAIDTFDSYELTNAEFQKIVDTYNSNIYKIKKQFEYFWWEKWLSKAEYDKKVDDLVQENLRQINEEFMNSFKKEVLQSGGANFITDFYRWNSYLADNWKWYNKKGEEIKKNDVTIGLANKYLETFRSFSHHMSELDYDWQFATQDPSRESIVNVLSDDVSLLFDVFMMWEWWLKFQAKTWIPIVWSIYESLLEWAMEVSWETILQLANMTLFVDWEWSAESQQKFKEAAWWLVFMQIMKEIEKAKWPIKAELKRDFNRSAFIKSLRVFTDKLAEWIKTIDILEEKAKIQQKNQPEVEKWDNEKAINKIEQETKVQKIILVRNIFQEALKAFNTVFEWELTMNAEDGRKPTLIDTLWNAATNIRRWWKWKSVDEILEERVQWSENDILRNERSIKEKEDRISELEKKPELTPEEIAEIDRLRWEIENLKAENDTITKRTENVKSFQTEWYHDKQVEIENRKVELENRETERDNLSQRLKDIDNEIINAKAEWDTKLVEELRAEKKDTKQQIKNIEQEISSMQRTIREMEWTASMRDILENMKEWAQETIQETREWFRQWGEEIATPEIEVEQTSTWTPEKIEWAEKVKWETPEETRSTITRILDIIQQFKNISSELYKKITQPKEDVEKDIKESELNRQARDEIFKQEKLSKKTREVMENSIWTDSILRIVNDFVSEQTNRKWEVTDVDLEKPRPSNDEIQRDVLSDGLTSIQSYVNRIKQLGKKIWELYDHLSKQPTIRVRDFINSKDFQSLLSENNLKLVEYRNGRWIYKREIVSEDGSRLSPEQQEIQKYMEDMVNDMLKTPWISEYDAHQIRRSFLKKKERKDNEYVSWVKKQLYNRFNNFLENTWQWKLLRKIDEWYAELSDSLEVISELLGKDSELKNNAKNQILNWNEDKLNQIEEILPWFKSLVELTRYAPEIVNATINAKMQYKQTRVWLWNWIRYAWVMIASKIWWFGWFLLWSLGFTSIERIWNNLKKKAIKTKLDWDLYNNFVDALKVEWNEKAKYKQGELKRIEELNKIKEWETDKRFQEIVDDAMQILIDKQAQQIIAEKQAKAEAEQRRIESENRRRQTEWNQAQQPIDNALPGVKPDVISPEWDITLWRWNVISPDKWPWRPKPLKESKPLTKVTEINKYNEAEQMIVDASLWKTEEKTYSPEAEKVASILEEQLNATTKIIEEDATNRVIEKWEELTDENIQKEMQREPSSIEEFIMEAEKWAPEESTNYDGADIKDLEDVVANPKKYPGVDIEAAKSALDKARKQNMKASVMQSPDQIKAQTEKAWVYKADQMEKEHNSWWEGQKEKTVRDTNRDPDALETTEEYDRIDKQLTPESWELATKYSKWYKGFYRSDKDQADKLRADMGKKPSQNITYTSSVDKIATLTNPKTRARVAQERLNKKKRLSEEEKAQLNQIIDQANVEIQAKEELKTQKTELANEYKALDEKREKTLSTEKRKEITKQMDEISKEFDKIEMEEWEAEREVAKMEYEENMKIEKDVSEIENETPQIDEIPQEVPSEKVAEWEKETSVEELFGRQPKQEKIEKPVTSEKTSTYEWKGKQNMEEFEKKFENDPEDRYTDWVDEYGEVVWQPKEVKLRNFVQKTFWKVDRSSSAFRDSQYDEQVAMATEIVDTNISYKDITLRYYKDTWEMKSDKGTSETAKAYFDRDNVQLWVWDPNYKYSPLHEVHHGLDYKFAQELWFDWEIWLSRIVTEEWFKAEWKYKDLIQRFQNLMQDIMRKQSKIKDDKILSPDETFARFGEAFGQWTKWEKVETSAKDYFDRDTNLFQRYVDWLSDMADAREKWVLEKWDLNPISEWEISEYRNLKAQEPPKELRDEIDSWCEITWIIGKNYLEKVKRLDSYIRKWIDMEDLTEIEKWIYKTIKEKYIPYQLDTLWEKVLDLWSATSNTKNKKTKWTFVPLEEWNVVAYPHLWWEAYNNLKNQWYIISKNEFYNKDKEK